MPDLFDWKVWLVAILVLVGWLAIAFFYPQDPNRAKTFDVFETSVEEHVVIVYETDKIKALAQVWAAFDEKKYVIVEEYYDQSRKAWLFRIRLK